MVIISFAEENYRVAVYSHSSEGASVVAATNDMAASDAFDYYTQAVGYFRFAIQEMNCRSIEVEVRRGGELVQIAEITRD